MRSATASADATPERSVDVPGGARAEQGEQVARSPIGLGRGDLAVHALAVLRAHDVRNTPMGVGSCGPGPAGTA